MDTDWLEDFLAVLEAGSFSKAAVARGVTQPALSRRIQALEAWYGTKLVDRRVPVGLTREGTKFMPVASRVLAELERVRQPEGAGAMPVRLTSMHTLSRYFVPMWLRRMQSVQPQDVTVEHRSFDYPVCLQALIRGDAELCLSYSREGITPALTESLENVVVGTDALLLVAHAETHDALAEQLERGEVAGMPLLDYTPGCFLHEAAHIAWGTLGHTLESRERYRDSVAENIKGQVMAGAGAAWLPRSAIAIELEGGHLKSLIPAERELKLQVKLYRTSLDLSPGAAKLWSGATQQAA